MTREAGIIKSEEIIKEEGNMDQGLIGAATLTFLIASCLGFLPKRRALPEERGK